MRGPCPGVLSCVIYGICALFVCVCVFFFAPTALFGRLTNEKRCQSCSVLCTVWRPGCLRSPMPWYLVFVYLWRYARRAR